MNFLSEYGLFLLETVTVVVAILIITTTIFSLAAKEKGKEKLTVKKMNKKFQDMTNTLNAEILDRKHRKQQLKQIKKEEKKHEEKHNIFVLTFKGDIKASAVETFRHEISAVLSVARKTDEVVILLESSGGMVNTYGLAASQIQRIKDKQIPITICVDKVAASGGYLMACVADRILAAPFAIIGSIGVVAQLPNFNRWLKKNDIDFEMMTAGKYKRTLTLFGENTEKAREKFQEDIEDIHLIFKDFIQQNRKNVDIDSVATGEHWLAKKAHQLNLVDNLMTSDDYLLQASHKTNIYEVHYQRKLSKVEKLTSAVHMSIDKIVDYWQEKNNDKSR